jgi:hypothetical protein
MLVGLAVFRRIIVNNTVDSFNINSTSCNIGSNQSQTFSADEISHCTVALTLIHPSMQGSNSYTLTLKFRANSFDSEPGSAKYDGTATLAN